VVNFDEIFTGGKGGKLEKRKRLSDGISIGEADKRNDVRRDVEVGRSNLGRASGYGQVTVFVKPPSKEAIGNWEAKRNRIQLPSNS